MIVRVARHTSDLNAIVTFYHEILGLDILGSFENHDNYDGVFLGLHNENWHLEFTTSHAAPEHEPDADDLFVFYTKSMKEYNHLIERFKLNGIKEVKPRNPYWKAHGKTFLDPDGFRIVISKLSFQRRKK